MNKFLIQNGTEGLLAEYKDQIIDDYKGNPFIEALPPIVDKEKVIGMLANYPKYNEHERYLENEYRLHLITQRIPQIFQPLPIHLELENKVSTMVRTGYTHRNPLNREYAEMFLNGYKDIALEHTCGSNTYNPAVSSLSIIGVSGMGKSTSLNRVLSVMPQVIIHTNYKGIKFSMYQVCWLKLDCPFDGSIKGLCLDFFSKVDSILGTNYFLKHSTSKGTVDTLLSVMTQVIRNIGLGLLVIDEIQHLSQAKSGGSDKMLNFFTTLVNIASIPIALVGTMKARNILQSDFRIARRGLGNSGNMIWERMRKDETWSLLMDSIWPYQWTRNKTPLTEQIIDALYEESQGIIDIAVKIYSMAQIRAINTGIEQVTVNLIREVAAENLKPVRGMLNALKSNNLKEIAKYEDICTVEFEEFLNREQSSIKVTNMIREYQQVVKQNAALKRDRVIFKLLDLGFGESKASRVTDLVIKKYGNDLNLNEMVLKSISLLELQGKNRKNVYNEDEADEQDIRSIIRNGDINNLTAYDALKQKNYIVNLNFSAERED